MSLLVVGSVAYDDIVTPFGKATKILGGAGTYICLSASYFNVAPKLISVVGGDFCEENLLMLNNHGIDTTGVQKKENEKTFFWSGVYHNDMNSRDSLATELNVLATFDPIVPEQYQGAEFLMLGNLSPVVQRTVIERLHKRPKLIVMDTMNFWMNNQLSELMKTIALVDVLTINEEEARQLSGEYSLVKASQKILDMGPEYLVIKKGEHGALLFSRTETFFAPALPLKEVFDPTGAGDSFAGGFIGYLAQNKEFTFAHMKNAIIVGSAMASFNVQKFGTENLQNLKKEEIFAQAQKFVDLVSLNIPL